MKWRVKKSRRTERLDFLDLIGFNVFKRIKGGWRKKERKMLQIEEQNEAKWTNDEDSIEPSSYVNPRKLLFSGWKYIIGVHFCVIFSNWLQ